MSRWTPLVVAACLRRPLDSRAEDARIDVNADAVGALHAREKPQRSWVCVTSCQVWLTRENELG